MKAKMNLKNGIKIDESQISTLISASGTIKNNEGKVLNYFQSRSTNASAESFNAKLKGFRSLLRGASDINFFLFRVETLFA
jgi:transposase